MTAREIAVAYAGEVLGWKNVNSIGCHPDPKPEGTFLVAIEGDYGEHTGVQMTLLVEGGQVTAETDIVDFFTNGGTLDETNAEVMPQLPSKKALLMDTGVIVATPGALEALQKNNSTGTEYLMRHLTGDWGDLSDDDKTANEEAIKTGARIMSSYILPDGTKFWIITDAEIDKDRHRQATTFLLPGEY